MLFMLENMGINWISSFGGIIYLFIYLYIIIGKMGGFLA